MVVLLVVVEIELVVGDVLAVVDVVDVLGGAVVVEEVVVVGPASVFLGCFVFEVPGTLILFGLPVTARSLS